MVAEIVSFGALKVTHKKMPQIPQMRWLSPELLLVANKATKKNLYLLGVTQQSGWILVNWTHFMAARGSTQAVFLSPCVSQDPSCDDGFVFLIMYSIIHLFPLSWACHRRSKIPVTSAHWCTKDAFLKHQKGAKQISKIMAAAITLANDLKTPDVSMGLLWLGWSLSPVRSRW